MDSKKQDINDPHFDRIWKIVTEIGEEERHFNNLQSRYRTLASTWLLATFSAIGFVVTEVIEIDAIQINKEILVFFICAAGFIGVTLLWIVDLLVYHRLLDSFFVEGLILEEKYSWIPKFRHNMMASVGGEGVLFRVVGFYIGMMSILLIIAGTSISIFLWNYGVMWGFISGLITILYVYIWSRFIIKKTENTLAFEKRLSKTRDKIK